MFTVDVATDPSPVKRGQQKELEIAQNLPQRVEKRIVVLSSRRYRPRLVSKPNQGDHIVGEAACPPSQGTSGQAGRGGGQNQKSRTTFACCSLDTIYHASIRGRRERETWKSHNGRTHVWHALAIVQSTTRPRERGGGREGMYQ